MIFSAIPTFAPARATLRYERGPFVLQQYMQKRPRLRRAVAASQWHVGWASGLAVFWGCVVAVIMVVIAASKDCIVALRHANTCYIMLYHAMPV